jgi:prepilin-type N-terminal cleavage/methylation domain-containing protein
MANGRGFGSYHETFAKQLEINMKNPNQKRESGFSLIELLIAMGVVVTLMAITSLIFGKALGIRTRESSRTDALTSAEAALNVMSREITNSGYGLIDNYDSVHNNGIILADSGEFKLRIRSNVVNTNTTTTDIGEDVTYYYDAGSKSIVRYDKSPLQSPNTTYLVNQISEVKFRYYDYTGSNSTPTASDTPTANTCQVQITVTVMLDDVQGQPKNRRVTLTSYVTLRNSNYMVHQY